MKQEDWIVQNPLCIDATLFFLPHFFPHFPPYKNELHCLPSLFFLQEPWLLPHAVISSLPFSTSHLLFLLTILHMGTLKPQERM